MRWTLLLSGSLKKFMLLSLIAFIMLISSCGGGGGGGDSSDNPVYTVTFDSQGATVAADPSSITVTLPETTVGILPTPPVKTGFVFSGWFTGVNGTGTEFSAGTQVTGNITVFASWETVSVITENYTKIATAYANAILSANISSSDTSDMYHVVSTLSNAGNSVRLVTAAFMDCSSAMLGVQGTYSFNNYMDANGVVLNGTLDYYTTGTSVAVFVIKGTISASGSANGSYIYNVKTDNGTLSGYAGITGYYYNYATSTISAIEPSISLPERPVIVYCGQDAPDAPGMAAVTAGNQQLALSWSAVSGATAYEVWFSDTNNSVTATQQGGDIAATNYILTGLSNGTKYYVWLKTKSSAGTSGFGTVANGTPGATPTVITTPIVGDSYFAPYIGGTSAKGGMNITNIGDSMIIVRGLCWNTSGSPTVNDSKTTDGSGSGIFTQSIITGLTENTTYYVRAYATNNTGTAYGAEISFNSGKAFGSDYADGYVFYNDGAGHGLVSAKTDQSTAIRWYNGTNILTAATAYDIGTGLANTNIIITAQGAVITSYAAGLARSCNDGAHSDWFLPSELELNVMYINLKSATPSLGGFADSIYWSSTDGSTSRAAAINFSNGNMSNGYKYDTYHVRAIRAFND